MAEQNDPADRNIEKARSRALRKGTPMARIRGYCVECVGGVHRDVRECCVTDCLLYDLRMGRKPKKGDASERS